MKRNARGFAIFTEFNDTYGATVKAVKSSSATGRRVWVSADGGATVPGQPNDQRSTAAHLSPAQARRLARALLSFADGPSKERARIRRLEEALVQACRCLKHSSDPSNRVVSLSLVHWLKPADRRKVEEP